MKITYLIWKTPYCNGVNPVWQEIDVQEFYALINSPEGRNRFFIKLESESENSNDGKIVIESTKIEYIKWRKEKNHTNYIRKQKQKSGYQVISYHAIEIEDDFYGEEVLEDTGTDVEADFIKSAENELLKEALSQLNEDEYRLVEYFYLSDDKGTLHGYSAITGTPFMTIQNRKKALLKKIKNFFEK